MTCNKTQKGFTLIEAFVAITILVMAIVGPLAIASQSASLASVTRDQIMANFLAQDAVEYIRWMRDTNELKSLSWLNGLSNCISLNGSASCYFDSSYSDPWSAHPITACSLSGCPVINYDAVASSPTYGLYGYDYGTPSSFTRTVSIKSPVATNTSAVCLGGNCEADVTVTVSWKNGALPHRVTVRENMMAVFGT